MAHMRVPGFRGLVVFYYAVGLSSQSQAAKALRVTPSSISEALHRLEVKLGENLFGPIRTRDPARMATVEPTVFGETLYRKIRQPIEALLKLEGYPTVSEILGHPPAPVAFTPRDHGGALPVGIQKKRGESDEAT